MKRLLAATALIFTLRLAQGEIDKKIKLNYELGKQYHYDYELNITNTAWELFDDIANFTYCTKFFIVFKTKDEGYLKIEDVAFKVDEEKREVPIGDLTEHCLKFAYNNGQITGLEANSNDKQWALNFKRGLLSVFQNSLNNFPDMVDNNDGKEEDVHGLCKTCYMIGKEIDETVEVRRIKNLTRCEHQAKEKYTLFSTPIHIPKEHISEVFEEDLQNYNILFPFSGSVQECRYFVKNGIYDKLLCNETIVLQGYDTLSYTYQNIRYVKTVDSDEKIAANVEFKKTSLLYEYDDLIHALDYSAEFDNAKKYIRELCDAYSQNKLLDSPTIFAKLVDSAKALNATQLLQLYNDTKDCCASSRDYYVDLLQHVGSECSIVAMLEFLQCNRLSEAALEEWLSTVAMYEPISPKILSKSNDLLRKNGSNFDILLTVSTIASTYCKSNENCKEDIKDILSYYEDSFMDSYSNLENDVNSEEVTLKVVLNLKALSNIALPTYSINATLSKILEDNEINPIIRVAALEVYRKRYCENSLPIVSELYKNQDENVEVRVASYLKVMECAGIEILPQLYRILKQEPSDQVTYFIWSHLNSTQVKEIEIENPHVIFVDFLKRSSLEDEENKNETTTEEATEATTILSEPTTEQVKEKPETPEEPKPLSVIALLENYILNNDESNKDKFKNCTFDKAVQVILNNPEMRYKYQDDYRKHSHFYKGNPSQYTNYSGYVIYSQSSFIPKSSLLNITYNPFNKPMDLLQFYTNSEGLEDYFLSLLGSKDILKKIANLKSSAGRKETSAYPKLSLGLKLFGNDIKYTIFNGEKSIDELVKEFNPVDKLKEYVSKGTHCQKSGILTDLSFSVPTASGFPLSMKLIVSYYGRFNLTTYKNETDNAKYIYSGNVKPGKALSISTSLGIDGFYASTGILGRLSGNLSYDLNTDLKLDGHEYSQVNLSLPEETMKLLMIRIELKSLSNEGSIRKSRFFDTDLPGPRCVSWRDSYPIDICYPENTFKGFFDRLRNGLVEIEVYIQKNNRTIKNQPLLSYERKKIGDEKYSIGVYVQNEEICQKNLTFNTKEGNLQAILESDGEKKLIIDGHYDKDGLDRFITWDIIVDGQPFNYWEASLRKQFTWENTKMNVMMAFYGFQGFARILMT